MPSPFPGMDPYIEDPAIWNTLRLSFMAGVQDQLYQPLRPNDVVRFAERRHEVEAADPAYATLVGPPLPGRTPIDDTVPVADRWVEISQPSGRPVTAIELLTPGGKVDGSVLQRAVNDRRSAAAHAGVNWVGIDLLRGGTPVKTADHLPRSDYLTVADRVAGPRRTTYAWPTQLGRRLPIVAVPLGPTDADVPLDIQAAVDRMYRVGGCDLHRDYSADPPLPPMSAEQLEWCRAQVAAW